MKFGQRVKIKSGFYEGCEGYVIAQDPIRYVGITVSIEYDSFGNRVFKEHTATFCFEEIIKLPIDEF